MTGPEPSDFASFRQVAPLLPGPGAVSTLAVASKTSLGRLVSTLVIADNSSLAFVTPAGSDEIRMPLGINETTALSRIASLLMAPLAVSFAIAERTSTEKTLR